MNALAQIIAARIRSGGPLTCAEFMQMALYHPELGYYERSLDQIGKRGDFYTSVSVGPLFGQMLAFQFSRWLDELSADQPRILEAGAHDGQLAADILAWLRQNRPDLAEKICYVIVESSSNRRILQQKKLAGVSNNISWVSTLEEAGPLQGIIFSNELLDAFPIRRLRWNAADQQWDELGVSLKGDQFCWMPLRREAGISSPPASSALADGFLTEAAPAATAWWRTASSTLQRGWLLTFDYGLNETEFLSPDRSEGTLRSYRKHRMTSDILADPGEQDITSHVHFDELARVGEVQGLVTEPLIQQGRWLTALLASFTADPTLPSWSQRETRQFQTLTHPQHLGAKFKVLIQKRR